MLFQIQFRVMEMEIVENVENVGDAGGGKKLKPKNLKSKIWRLFNDYDDKHVKCMLCSKMIMVTDYSTKGLREHVIRKHKTQWNEINPLAATTFWDFLGFWGFFSKQNCSATTQGRNKSKVIFAFYRSIFIHCVVAEQFHFENE